MFSLKWTRQMNGSITKEMHMVKKIYGNDIQRNTSNQRNINDNNVILCPSEQ